MRAGYVKCRCTECGHNYTDWWGCVRWERYRRPTFCSFACTDAWRAKQRARRCRWLAGNGHALNRAGKAS
jgi:hypothetical protein